MRPVSPQLLNIITGSHTTQVRARSCLGFPQSVNPATTSTLAVKGGQVRMESSATIRATADLEVQDRWGDLWPAGVELMLEYGVQVAGASTEWVSLGFYRLDTVGQDGINGALKLNLSDRMAQVYDTEAVFPWVAPAGTTHADLFSSLLYGQSPTTWFHPDAGVFPSSTVARQIVADYDMGAQLLALQLPLDKPFGELLQDVCDGLGKRMFFDYLGRLNVVDAAVSTADPAVYRIKAGAEGTLRGLKRQVSRDGVHNSLRAEGSAPTEGSPPWGYDMLDNAESPGLSWYGRFGRVLRKYSSPLLTTNAQAQAAAESLQSEVRGLPYELSLDMVANPALEPLDVVEVAFPGLGRSDTPPVPGMGDAQIETHVIDSLTFPLVGGNMAVTTRAGVITL